MKTSQDLEKEIRGVLNFLHEKCWITEGNTGVCKICSSLVALPALRAAIEKETLEGVFLASTTSSRGGCGFRQWLDTFLLKEIEKLSPAPAERKGTDENAG